MYQEYNIEAADFYDDTSVYYRFLMALILLDKEWIIHPRLSMRKFRNSEIMLRCESLRRIENKLYLNGVLKEN